jgi:hypothetical protein
MRRLANLPATVALLALLGIASVPAPSLGDPGESRLANPRSQVRGTSLEEWNALQTQRAIEAALGGGTDLSDTVQGVRLLPGSLPGSGPTATFDITLRPGTPFVAAPFFVFGEHYDDPTVPDDNPADPIIDLIFGGVEVTIVLDGRALLEGSGADLNAFRWGPVQLDEPIVYAQPQPRGPGLNALSALFVMGIGAMYRPLPVGQHTLVYTVHSDFFGDFEVTYNITVSPK